MSLKQSFARSQSKFIVRNAFLILGIIAAITVMVFPAVKKLKMKANFLSLLPEDMPSVTSLNQLISKVGGTSFIIIAVESSNEAAAKQAAEIFSKKAVSFESVDSIDNRTSVPEFENKKLLFLTLESVQKLKRDVKGVIDFHRRKNSPFSLDLVEETAPEIDIHSLKLEEKVYGIGGFSRKEANTYMRVVLLKPKFQVGDFGPFGRLLKDIEGLSDEIQKELKYPVTLGVTGPYKTRYDEYRAINQDLRLTTTFTLVMIFLQMVIGFRNIRSLVLAFLPLMTGMLWMCAFASYSIGYLNLITGFLLGIMTGMGMDYCLHMLVDLEEERKKSATTAEAIEKTIASIGAPLITSALTTAIAFATLTISRFEGYRHFGMISGAGLVLCLLVVFYGLPSLIVVGEKLKIFKWKAQPMRLQIHKPKAGPVYAMVAGGVLFSLVSLTQIPRLAFEYDFSNLQESGSDAMELAKRIGDHFGVVLNPVALMTKDRKSAAALAARVNQYASSHPDTNIDFAASLVTHVPKNQPEKIVVMREIEQIIEERSRLIQELSPEVQNSIKELRVQLAASPIKLKDLPTGIREQYEGKTGELSVAFVYPNQSIMDGRVAKRFVEEIRSLNIPEDILMAGEPVIYVDILNMLERDTPIALLVSLSVIVLLLFIHFRHPADVIWVLAPVVIGFLWMMGLTGIFGVRFNYMNMAILPCVLGVGIDNGIYIFHRYKREKKSTMSEILEKTGKAVVLSSTTTIIAFTSLLLARHRGMASMGALGVLGFASCLLSSVIFVPALIEFFERKYWKLFPVLKFKR